MINFNLICRRCGSDYALEVTAPRPDAIVTCGICGHEATFADWAAATEVELSTQTGFSVHNALKAQA